MTTIYRGVNTGPTHAPHCPLTDALMGERLVAKGFAGLRKERQTLFATTNRKVAFDYACEKPEHLFVLRPLKGSHITWLECGGDMLYDLAEALDEMRYDVRWEERGGRAFEILEDMNGDVDLFETYLSFGSVNDYMTTIMDVFLSLAAIREFEVKENGVLPADLDGHNGEVWINGPCDMIVAPPEANSAHTTELHAA